MAKSLIRAQNRKKEAEEKKEKNKNKGFFSFFFGSGVSNLVLLTNFLMYYYTHYYVASPEAVTPLILYPANLMKGNFWCFLTAGFIHHDLSHLLFNMLGVFIFAKIVERKLGFLKTLFIYLGSLSIAMLFSTAVYVFFLEKNVAIIGASGAVMGLISAAMLLDPFCITYEMLFPLPVMVKGWLFFYVDVKGFLSGEMDGISHISHLCGFLSVGILVYFLSQKDKARIQTGVWINLFSFVAFVLLGKWLIVNV